MIAEKDLENISSIISLSDAYFSCKPQKPCEIAACFSAGNDTAPSMSHPDSDGEPVLHAGISPEKENEAARIDSNDNATVTPDISAKEPSAVGDDASSSLQNIARKIASCTRCRLCGGRKNTVPGIGVPNPLVLVIGEGPGADEDATGEPFVGKAGQLLDKMLGAICLSRHTNCFIANIVKCRPPNNRDPMPDEAEACRAFLDAQISVLKPKMILAVGRIAAQNILGTTTGINRLRGQFYEYRGIPLLPTYHPSALLRNEEMKRPAWEDLKMFRARLEEITGQSFTTATQTGRNG